MAGLYAAGKKALASCDRCGFTYKLLKLKEEYDNRRLKKNLVCPKCKDPDHPQNYAGETPLPDDSVVFEPKSDTGIVTSRDGNSIIYRFSEGNDGWSPLGGSIALSGDYLTHTWTSITTPQLYQLGLSIDPSIYTVIRARFKVDSPIELKDSWSGNCNWVNLDPIAGSAVNDMPEISMGDNFFELKWDASSDAAWSGSIQGIGFIIYGIPASTGSIDWEWIKIEEKII